MRASPGAWVVVLGSVVLPGCSPSTAPAPWEWGVDSGDLLGRRYSPLDEIDRTNVSRLEPVWVYRTGDMRARPPSTIQCTPIVVDGTMYLTTPGLKVVALEAATGRRVWEFDPFHGRGGRGVNRGVTFWRDGDHVAVRPTRTTVPLKGRLRDTRLIEELERERVAERDRDERRR